MTCGPAPLECSTHIQLFGALLAPEGRAVPREGPGVAGGEAAVIGRPAELEAIGDRRERTPSPGGWNPLIATLRQRPL